MATIKSYTDIEQSKKLAEILPLESADMGWNVFFDGTTRILPLDDWNLTKDGDGHVKFYHAWSLAALLDILPDRTCVYKKTYKDGRVKYKGVMEGNKELILKDNPIDACYELILKLNELDLL